MRYTTTSGHSVQFTRVGDGYDVHTRNGAGETVSTVWLTTAAARSLMIELEA
jgi:hypothetical protein